MSKRSCPPGLGDSAQSLWADVTSQYDLRVDELQVLEQACREADLIAKLEQAQATEPMLTTGSMGQKVISPYISELRQHRAIFSQLLRQLKLPDENGASERSSAARAAANARWGNRGA